MTFICQATPQYDWLKKVKALEPHKFQQWWNAAISLREKVGKDSAAIADDDLGGRVINQANFPDVHTYGGLLMDDAEVKAWNDAGVEVTVSRVKGLASNARDLPNTVYQISVASVGLLQIQCAEVLEDCCTNELQNWLDRGWRILAVCPPNDTRRPSYVMGHMDKEPHR